MPYVIEFQAQFAINFCRVIGTNDLSRELRGGLTRRQAILVCGVSAETVSWPTRKCSSEMSR